MEKKIKLFRRLEIETQSTCNRHCVTCLRNSIPDRESVAPWFTKNQLSLQDIERILQESKAIGFSGEVCLSHYNEPLQDERIIDIAKLVRSLGFSRLFFCTNGDYLTDEIAESLDGLLNDIGVALYMEDPIRSKREKWIRGLFKKTRLNLSHGEHMVTHYSPLIETGNLIKSNRGNPCHHPTVRMIVNHRGQMLLCCDDLTGNFDLGTIHEKSVEELWFSEKHQNYVIELSRRGGRKIHPHCLSCPRAGLWAHRESLPREQIRKK